MGNPYENFAANLKTDIATNGMETAYKHFQGAIDLALTGNTFAQKQVEWTKYAKALEASGALPKLGGSGAGAERTCSLFFALCSLTLPLPPGINSEPPPFAAIAETAIHRQRIVRKFKTTIT